MTQYYPVVVDAENLKFKELPAGDTLNLTDATIYVKDIELSAAFKQLKTVIPANGSLDLEQGTFFTTTLTASDVLTFDNPPSSNVVVTFSVEVSADGPYSVSWPAAVEWESGITPSIDTDGTALFTFYTSDGGVTYRGTLVYQSTS